MKTLTAKRSAKILLASGIALLLSQYQAAALELAPRPTALALAKPAREETRPASKPENAPDTVELAALYYYAKEGQTKRVEAEARRLLAKYPAFAMPADLYQSDDQPRVDETPLWDLYKAADFAGIEALSAKLSADNPGWTPSADFTGKVERARLRQQLTEDHERQDWASLAAHASGIDTRTEPDIDLLWMLIEAYRETGSGDRMTAVYRDILFRDQAPFDPPLLIATLQKAMQDFPAAEIRAVIAQMPFPAEQAEAVEGLKRDLQRRELALFNADVSRKDPLPPATVDPLRQGADITDMQLLGWYNLKIGRPAEAETWFRRASDRQPEAASLKGLYLSLRDQKRESDARALVTAHLEEMAEDSDFLLEALSPGFANAGATIAPAEVKAYSDAILKSQSPDHAEMLGWYAYNSRQFDAASAWFDKSFGWEKRPTALKGLVLSAAQLRQKDRLASLRKDFAAAYPDAFADQKIAPLTTARTGDDVGTPVANVSPRYVDHLKARRYGQCLADIAALEARRAIGADVAVVKGWCALGLGRPTEARNAFATALDARGAVGSDAAYGMALALVRTGQGEDAEAVISRYPLSAERNREIRGQIYAQRASAAFKAGQYRVVLAALDARLQLVPEGTDLSRLRGWSHYHIGNRAQARAIFTRLNLVLDDKANRQALAVINGE